MDGLFGVLANRGFPRKSGFGFSELIVFRRVLFSIRVFGTGRCGRAAPSANLRVPNLTSQVGGPAHQATQYEMEMRDVHMFAYLVDTPAILFSFVQHRL